MKPLTKTMRDRLNYMQITPHHLIWSSRYDRTMVALKERGLVWFSPARKYGRDSWHLTDEGRAFELK